MRHMERTLRAVRGGPRQCPSGAMSARRCTEVMPGCCRACGGRLDAVEATDRFLISWGVDGRMHFRGIAAVLGMADPVRHEQIRQCSSQSQSPGFDPAALAAPRRLLDVWRSGRGQARRIGRFTRARRVEARRSVCYEWRAH
jgi:hypothetical protein